MSLILSGSDGVSDIDGTAATPAIRGTDANTGIFFESDVIGFSEDGTEVARFNADAQFVAAAGTASLPVITTTGDVNTGIFFSAADTIDFAEGGVATGQFDSSGNFKFNSGYGSVATAYGCRAWVNLNGTGTPAARASGNVSSIGDNGAGDYTINFTTAMPDANYANVFGSNTDNASGNFVSNMGVVSNSGSVVTKTTSALRVLAKNQSWVGTDGTEINVAIFR
jgi:hypothetical protein